MVANLLGGKLVDRDSGADIAASGLFRPGASQESGAGAGVVASSVFSASPIGVCQAGEDLQVLTEFTQRLQGFAKLVIGPAPGGTPLVDIHAVRNIKESCPEWIPSRCGPGESWA